MCIAGADGAGAHNECDILTFTRLSDDSFFFAGGYYGSAHLGGHTLKKQAFRTALLGVIDGSGKVKWTKGVGVSWHNEISAALALDAHRVMVSGIHANGFHASLPFRKVRPVVSQGVAQDMGFHAEEAFVGVWNDDGKLEWAKNVVDLLGVPWSEDGGGGSVSALESDGAGGALCTGTAGTTRYRVHIDGKGNASPAERTPIEELPIALRYPQPPPAPPGRSFSIDKHVTLAPLGTWMTYADHKSLQRTDAASIAKVWAEDVHHVLWRWSPSVAWAFAIGDGESRGADGLLVGADGIAYATAPSVRVTSDHPPFTEVSLLRVEPDGRVAWRRPLWALSLPAAPNNRVEVHALRQNESGELVMHIAYTTRIAVGGVALPVPLADAVSMEAEIVVAPATGDIQRLEWLEAHRNCLFDYAPVKSAPHALTVGEDVIVSGNAFGSWNTAACGKVLGAPSVIARFKKAS
ncbi:MAG: hypothetical protein QOI41_1343 [Myxococcales bacterium]|nr:hypothetical protein [Myxococcales bacterium]